MFYWDKVDDNIFFWQTFAIWRILFEKMKKNETIVNFRDFFTIFQNKNN
jgi:hypothetical protein